MVMMAIYNRAFLHKDVMQYTKHICLCVIITTILNVIAATTCVTNYVYSNITMLAFMERYLAQVKCTMYCPESLIQFCPCNVTIINIYHDVYDVHSLSIFHFNNDFDLPQLLYWVFKIDNYLCTSITKRQSQWIISIDTF
jgi:hypothetical protein